MQSIAFLLRSRSIDVRIAAAFWCVYHHPFDALLTNSLSLTNLIRSQTHHGLRDNAMALAVIHALNNIIVTTNESQRIRMRACFVLCRCIAMSSGYCTLTQVLSPLTGGRFGHHSDRCPMWHPL